jgi:hypothetical protein
MAHRCSKWFAMQENNFKEEALGSSAGEETSGFPALCIFFKISILTMPQKGI